jgi:hypothetical protein
MMYARAFGGSVVHILQRDDWSSAAICGYTPRSSEHWRNRAADLATFREPICPRCAAKQSASR